MSLRESRGRFPADGWNRFFFLGWLVVGIPAGSLAGESPETGQDEVIDLNPYVVTGEDMGYRSNSVMDGLLMQGDLRDIGFSVSVLNEALIRDSASKDIEDILLLTYNTEIGGLGGNFSATQVEFDGVGGAGVPIPELQLDNPRGGITRIRGLSEADLTRDYFITDVPFDTFKSNRVAVHRGANSILFGIGSPGGIVNATTIKADFLGNKGQIKLETDQYGSRRGSFRYNYALLPDRLAILVA